MDELPEANCILFSNDCRVGHAAATWSYEEERVITSVTANPIPFNLPHNLQKEHANEQFTVRFTLVSFN